MGLGRSSPDDVEIMVAYSNEHTHFDRPVFAGSFYFNTEHVDELWKEFKEKTNVLFPIENFEYGMREFDILDNNGYILQFGEDLEEIPNS